MDPAARSMTYQLVTPTTPDLIHMPAVTSSPSRLPGYDLAPPTEVSALASLERVFGAERGRETWATACSSAGLVMGFVHSQDALLRATAALTAQGGAAATVARSITIRMRTHAQLLARSGTTPSGAAR